MKLLIRVLEVPMAEILPVSNVLDPFEGRSLSLNDNFPTCWMKDQALAFGCFVPMTRQLLPSKISAALRSAKPLFRAGNAPCPGF